MSLHTGSVKSYILDYTHNPSMKGYLSNMYFEHFGIYPIFYRKHKNISFSCLHIFHI